MSARDRILARVRRALAGRPEAVLPPIPEEPSLREEAAFRLFQERLEAAGGRVLRVAEPEAARALLAEAAAGVEGAWVGPEVPAPLRPDLPDRPPETAGLGVSWALAGVAETGSVVLSSREGRKGQLLVPRHLVWLPGDRLFARLAEALAALKGADAAALALHSGPSKSADIGQIMVKGVHGPGELWVGVVAFEPEEAGDGATELTEALSRLVGGTLRTKRGEPFLVEAVSERVVRVRTRGGEGKRLELPVSYLARAVERAREGADLSGPSRLRKEVGDRAAAYAWAILHALGYV